MDPLILLILSADIKRNEIYYIFIAIYVYLLIAIVVHTATHRHTDSHRPSSRLVIASLRLANLNRLARQSPARSQTDLALSPLQPQPPMGLSRSTRIYILLAIDVCFFFAELITGHIKFASPVLHLSTPADTPAQAMPWAHSLSSQTLSICLSMLV